MLKKLGRPKLPKEAVRAVYPLRLSNTELERFKKAANTKEMTLPEWIRETLTKAST
jgi:hypothetical protein